MPRTPPPSSAARTTASRPPARSSSCVVHRRLRPASSSPATSATHPAAGPLSSPFPPPPLLLHCHPPPSGLASTHQAAGLPPPLPFPRPRHLCSSTAASLLQSEWRCPCHCSRLRPARRMSPQPPSAPASMRPRDPRGTCGISADGNGPRSELLRRCHAGAQEGLPYRELESRGGRDGNQYWVWG